MIRPVILFSLLALPSAALAQTPVDWNMQVNVLDAGDRIVVRTADSSGVRGKVLAIDGESITVARNGRPVRVAAGEVDWIERHDSVWNGGAIGFTAGFGAGVLMMSTCDPGWFCEHSPQAILTCGALTGGFAFGIGVLFDAIVHGDHTVYRRNDRRVTVTPMVTPRSARVGVAVTF